MSILDTALKTAEQVGLRDRTPYERARASYNDLTSQASSLVDYLPSWNSMPSLRSLPTAEFAAPVTDWTGIMAGVIVGVAVGFGLGLYFKESVTPALESARKQARKAVDAVQEQLPTRLNITRLDEQTADKK